MRHHHHHHHMHADAMYFDGESGGCGCGGGRGRRRGRRPHRRRDERGHGNDNGRVHSHGPHGGRGHGHGPHGHGGGHGHGPGKGRGRRARRGDLRAVTLLLLADEPMHGYQIMSTIAERTGRHWTPGPGATYPTISLLEDEGLISVAPVDGKKTATITDLGRAEVEEHRAEWAAILDRYADDDASPRSPHIIRGAMMDLRDAVKHVDFNGTDADRDRLIEILRDTTAKVRTLTAGNRADTDTGSDTDGTA